MNYIKQLNAFYELAEINPLSTGQIALWNALMFRNNKCAWAEWFTTPNSILCELTGLSTQGMIKARNALIQRNLIEMKKGKRSVQAPKYKIIKLYKSVTDSVTDSVTESVTLNKHKQKLKQKNIYIVEIKEIIDYLNEKAGTRYKPSSKKTKDLISARLNEGFTIDDFKQVIDNKVNDWTGTEWEKFLRPETLFSNKFEGYLNQNIVKPKKEQVDRFEEEYEMYPEEEIERIMNG